MFGGKSPGQRGYGTAGKIIVFEILKRNGKIRVFSITERKNEIVQKMIQHHTKLECLYYTDDWNAYAPLSLLGNHVVVSKEKGKTKGRDHINAIEGFFKLCKHCLYPYRVIPPNFFHFCLGEISFKFNHRHENILSMIFNLLKQTLFNKNLVQSKMFSITIF
ncbi:MAG: transposase [Endomicrobiia bacterium]